MESEMFNVIGMNLRLTERTDDDDSLRNGLGLRLGLRIAFVYLEMLAQVR